MIDLLQPNIRVHSELPNIDLALTLPFEPDQVRERLPIYTMVISSKRIIQSKDVILSI